MGVYDIISGDDDEDDRDGLLTETGPGGLLGGGYLGDQPFVEYLDEREQPRHVFFNEKQGLRYERDGDTQRMTPGSDYRAIAAVTDKRVLFVVGESSHDGIEGDQPISLPYTQISGVDAVDGMLRRRLTLTTATDATWSFPVRNGVELAEIEAYVRRAVNTWERVAGACERAEQTLDHAREHLADDDVDGAAGAREDARSELDLATDLATEFSTDESDAIRRHVAAVEARYHRVTVDELLARAAERRRTADWHLERESYGAARDAYLDARETYDRAEPIAEEYAPDAADSVEAGRAAVEEALTDLQSLPLERAEHARRGAESVEDPEVAVTMWAETHARYRDALELEWGVDHGHFKRDTDTLRVAVAYSVSRLIESRRALGTEHQEAGSWYFEVGREDEARRRFRKARAQFQRARELAREYRAGSVEEIDADLAALEAAYHERQDGDSDADRSDAGEDAAPGSDPEGTDELTVTAVEGDADPQREAPISRSRLKHILRNLDPADLAAVIGELWSEMGWKTTVMHGAATDEGDVLATRDHPVPEKTLVRIEHGSDGTVGTRDVRSTATLRQQGEAVDSVVLATTDLVTDPAREVARELNVKLVDSDRLCDIIDREESYEVVERYW